MVILDEHKTELSEVTQYSFNPYTLSVAILCVYVCDRLWCEIIFHLEAIKTALHFHVLKFIDCIVLQITVHERSIQQQSDSIHIKHSPLDPPALSPACKRYVHYRYSFLQIVVTNVICTSYNSPLNFDLNGHCKQWT